jgi:hypothetical protein
MSTASLAPDVNKIEGLHEAFRHSIAFDSTSGTFQRIAPKPPKAYTESTYSSDIELGPKDRPFRGPSSERYAESYQNLLGMPDDEEPRGRTVRQESRSENRMTKWCDFKSSIDREPEGFE